MTNSADIHPSIHQLTYKEEACYKVALAYRDVKGYRELAKGGARVAWELNESTKRYHDAMAVISELWVCPKDPEFRRMMAKQARRAYL